MHFLWIFNVLFKKLVCMLPSLQHVKFQAVSTRIITFLKKRSNNIEDNIGKKSFRCDFWKKSCEKKPFSPYLMYGRRLIHQVRVFFQSHTKSNFQNAESNLADIKRFFLNFWSFCDPDARCVSPPAFRARNWNIDLHVLFLSANIPYKLTAKATNLPPWFQTCNEKQSLCYKWSAGYHS